MRRKSLVYFIFLAAALWFFGLAAWLTVHLDGEFVELGLLRFVVLCLGIGCSLGTWATAVVITSIHKKTWALYLTVSIVLLAALAFATISCHPPHAGH